MVSPIDRFIEFWWWILNSFQWIFNTIVIVLTILSWFKYARKAAATILIPRITSYKPPPRSALLAFAIIGSGLFLIPFILIFSIIYAFLPYLTFWNLSIISSLLAFSLMIWGTITDELLVLFIGLKKKSKGFSRFGRGGFGYYKRCPKCKREYEVRDDLQTVIIRNNIVIGYKCPFCHEESYL